jgi:Putative lumazine-binding
MKTRIFSALLIILSIAFGPQLHAQATPLTGNDDRTAIRAAALDYIEGWYEGNAERMDRALHPELAKRMVSSDPKTGKSTLNQMGAMTLVQNTRKGYGTHFPKEQQLEEVTILDVYKNAASVKIDAATWVDYLQLAKWNGEWKIVNVLWELKPQPAFTSTAK